MHEDSVPAARLDDGEPPPRSDALVVFGYSGDLAKKQILPSLYAMARDGSLDMPVVGVAAAGLDDTGARALVRDSVEAAAKKSGDAVDAAALGRLLDAFRAVDGDYREPATFTALKRSLGGAERPAFYLAIPPALFETVIGSLGSAGLTANARLVVEKPFGHDLASARALGAAAREHFAEASIFRIDHYLGKESIMNLVYFRFANSFVEPIWNRDHISSVQVTLAESFGLEGRAGFYEKTGALRDVVQNHLLQIVAVLAGEPPPYTGLAAIQAGKTGVFRAIRPVGRDDVVRGQYDGYRDENDVAADSDTETFCAVRLFVDTWRWAGVPWLLRAGKKLPATVVEIYVQLKPPPQDLFHDRPAAGERCHYLRIRLQPKNRFVVAVRVKKPGKAVVGEEHDLVFEDDRPGAEAPYERLLDSAMSGDAKLFTSQDAVEAAWAVFEPVLRDHAPVARYAPGSWGPAAADALAEGAGGWYDPQADGAES